MSDAVNPLEKLGITVDSRGLSVSVSAETEGHAFRRHGPVQSEATAPAETEAHLYRRSGPSVESTSAETEAHGVPTRGARVDATPAETEAHGTLILTFAPDAPEQTIEVRYRPPARSDAPPEVEVHAFTKWSDRRLKRAVRAL
jgi:hypothetical protein